MISGARRIFEGARPGDIIIFYDPRSRLKIDHSQCNQPAVVLPGKRAIFLRRRPVVSSLSDVAAAPHAKLIMAADEKRRSDAAAYFLENQSDAWAIEAGFNAIGKENFEFVRTPHLFPERSRYAGIPEYEAQWSRFLSVLKPGDVIFSRNDDSLASRIVAACTHGPWSHVMIYIGDGEIAESTVPSVRRAPIEVYKSSSVWLCAYRHISQRQTSFTSLKTQELSSVIDRYTDGLPPGYNYTCAAWHGVRAFAGDTKAIVPNTMIITGNFRYIAQV